VSAPLPLLEVEDLHATFRGAGRDVKAVRGASFAIRAGETLGLIGESGSGKTVTGLAILRLLPAHARVDAARVAYKGKDLTALDEAAFRKLRGIELGMIFQDPAGSFNPAKRIGWHLREAIRRRGEEVGGWEAEATAMLGEVGIRQPGRVLGSYPHQLSGGMLQRALIAMVFLLRPSLIIADEPTTNLDNLVERQILTLIRAHQTKAGAAVLFVTHDLGMAGDLCDRIAVMYAGEIVEIGPTAAVLERPMHPYAQGLLATSQSLDRADTELHELPGEPGGIPPEGGCAFAPRCIHAMPVCRERRPVLIDVGPDHRARCLLHEGAAP
jgi:oligopeptide/dipeptide ABC transporter ATP-binding protein